MMDRSYRQMMQDRSKKEIKNCKRWERRDGKEDWERDL